MTGFHAIDCSRRRRDARSLKRREHRLRPRAQGFPLTHLDSHNDVHTAPGIADVVIAIARASEIARVRPARNCGARQGTIRWIQHHVYNVLLNRQGLKQVMYFGTTDHMLWLAGKGRLGSGSSAEVMTHPRLSAEGVVVDAPSVKPLAECLRELESHPVTRVRAAG
jgi:predicted glycoside hydrolase/deacetylase ChbG (UPF0249 family)